MNGTTIRSNKDLTTQTKYINVTANQTSVGNGAATAAPKSTAIGQNATVQTGAEGGTALGYGAVVNTGAANSVALGAGSVASEANTVSVGSAGNERKITNVAAGVSTTDAVNYGQLKTTNSNVSTNSNNIAGNSRGIAVNSHGIAVNSQGIAVNSQGIAINRNDIAVNRGYIVTNAQDIAVNREILFEHDVRITANSVGIAANRNYIGEVDERARAGTALATALSALVPNARDDSDTQVSLGAGYYEGAGAMSLGAFHYIDNDVLINAAASVADDGRGAVRAGVTWGF